MRSYKSPEPQQKCSCAQEALCGFALTRADVVHRQTAETSSIYLEQRLHLEKMSAEEKREETGDTRQQKRESYEYNKQSKTERRTVESSQKKN